MKLLAALPLLGALALLSFGQTARAEHFDVDTSTISGQTGSLDFLFNPNSDGTTPLDSRVTISNFSGGTLGAVTSHFNTSGSLPGSVTIYNTGANNELVQLFTFGNTLGFDTSFPSLFVETSEAAFAPFALPDESSTFEFSLLDTSQKPYATTDPSGANTLADIAQDPYGSLSASQTYRLAPASVVPEPSSALSLAVLSGFVLLLVGMAVRKQRKTA